MHKTLGDAVVQRTKQIDIVPFLEPVLLESEEFAAFLQECKKHGVKPNEYLAIALRDEIHNALKYHLIE